MVEKMGHNWGCGGGKVRQEISDNTLGKSRLRYMYIFDKSSDQLNFLNSLAIIGQLTQWSSSE